MSPVEKDYVLARKRLIRANLAMAGASQALREANAERNSAENAVYRAELALEEQVKKEAAK